MRTLVGAALGLACAAFVLGSFPSVAFYAYVPNFLVVSTSDEADHALEELEVSLGVEPAEDPAWADRPDLKRLDRTARVMEKHWQRLDAVCDSNAVFALMYLTTTYGVRYHIQHGYFADNDYLSIITVSFADLYLDAYAAWERGDREAVPLPWLEAFDYATSGESGITDDELLGMNAHINYDLAVAIAGLGTHAADGTLRKPDMDRINHVLAAVTDDVGYEIAKFYGPAPPTQEPDRGSGHNLTPDQAALLEGIYLWREHAWNNAVAIESAPDEASRAAHDDSMQQAGGTAAQSFQSPKLVSPAAERLSYCQANP